MGIQTADEVEEKFQEYSYKVINTYHHDNEAFTQGLFYDNGYLYEGTGLNGNSSLRKVDIKSGNIVQYVKLEDEYFGEGIAYFNNKIVQLTWKSNIGFVYDKETFNLLNTFNYVTEGWGLAYDGKDLIMSDGTSSLYYLDTSDFTVLKTLNVYDGNGPIDKLNELEFIDEKIYANVWLTNYIIIISPNTGKVIGRIDLTDLVENIKDGNISELNGIAYDEDNDRLFITGKLWPYVYEIELIPN
jgi:glutamine cyclotransferase